MSEHPILDFQPLNPVLLGLYSNLLLLLFFCFSANAQIAKNKCKFLGNIIAGSVPADFGTYWNQVTPENSGKWESVESTKDNMNWTGLDLAYNYAKDNNLPFKQHTFVWGQQQPSWIGSLSQEEQKEQVEQWIKLYCERYPDTDYIDVVNEPLHAVPNYAAALGGTGATGWDWVIWAFEKAKEYCPDAKLALNDYSIISNNGNTDTYIQIINLLKERNLIDIIGEQGHFLETTPLATITANLNKLHATGVPIHISEFDINMSDDTQQRDKYQELFPVLWSHAGVQGITLWGYRQGQIWRENAYLVRSNNTERPALTWLKSYVPSVSGGSFCITTSMDKEMQLNVRVYPNPTMDGNFTIELKKGKAEVQIVDLQGRVLKQLYANSQQPLNVQLNTAPGLYIVKICDGQDTTYRKVIVE